MNEFRTSGFRSFSGAGQTRRQFLTYGGGFLGGALLAACTGRSPQTADPDPAPDAAGDFSAAILLPQTAADGSWSEAGYRGLERIREELGARVEAVEGIDFMEPAEVEARTRELAEAGYGFVIGHGSQHLTLPAAEAVAPDFPRTRFAIVAGQGPGNNANLGILNFQDAELGYLAGAVAGLKTQTGVVSFVGGFDYPNLKLAADRYGRGAQAVRLGTELRVGWVGSWTDEAKARTIAREHAAAGADIIAVNAEPAGLPLHQEAAELGVHTIGWYQDQYERAPDRVLVSAVQNIPVLLVEAAKLVRRGLWEGRQYYFGLAEGAVDLSPFRGSLSADQEAQIQEIRQAIATGALDVLARSPERSRRALV